MTNAAERRPVKSYRLDRETHRQIDALAAHWQTSQSNAIARCVERMYQEEMNVTTPTTTYKGFRITVTDQLGGYGYDATDLSGNGADASAPNPQTGHPLYQTPAQAMTEAKRRISRYWNDLEYKDAE